MTISLNFNTTPVSMDISSAPGVSVSEVTTRQMVFDTSDIDVNSAALYILKNGSLGSQNWVKLATNQQLTAAIASLTTRTASYPSRTLNTAFQPSTTKDSIVSYSVDIACTLSLTSGQTGTVFLEICPNSAFTSGVQEISRAVNGNTGTLTIGLNITQNVTASVSGFVPAGYYARLRTANTTGTPTFNYRSGQEVSL